MNTSIRFRAICFLSVLLLIASVASAEVDSNQLASKLREARERFSDRQNLLGIYRLKQAVANELLALDSSRNDQVTYVRRLGIVIDGFPRRRNNLQQDVYNEWLAARDRLTSIEQAINDAKLRQRAIDEQALTLTENNLKRPFPNNRRDIQVLFPKVDSGCEQAFRELKLMAEEAAKEQEVSRDRIVADAMSTLGPKQRVEAEFGNTALFLDTFRRYCAGATVFGEPKPATTTTPTKSKIKRKR
jgi:hypothetical protein